MTAGDPDPEHPGPADDRPGPAPGPRVRNRSVVRHRAGEALLPDTTRDERDIGWGDAAERDDDERLLREVPPHHGD